jgi:hypothetical protein
LSVLSLNGDREFVPLSDEIDNLLVSANWGTSNVGTETYAKKPVKRFGSVPKNISFLK